MALEWAHDCGLAHLTEVLTANLVDGRLLNTLSKEEIRKYLKITRKVDQLSFFSAVELLRMHDFNRQVSYLNPPFFPTTPHYPPLSYPILHITLFYTLPYSTKFVPLSSSPLSPTLPPPLSSPLSPLSPLSSPFFPTIPHSLPFLPLSSPLSPTLTPLFPTVPYSFPFLFTLPYLVASPFFVAIIIIYGV